MLIAGGVNSFTDVSFTMVVYGENDFWATEGFCNTMSGHWTKLGARLSRGTVSRSDHTSMGSIQLHQSKTESWNQGDKVKASLSLTLILIKCFEKLVLQHIKDNIPASLDPHQFAFRANRSTKDTIPTTLSSHILKITPTSAGCLLISVQHSTQSSP